MSLTFTADRMIWVRDRKTKVTHTHSKQKDLGQRQEDLLHLGHLQMTGRFGSETGRPRTHYSHSRQKYLGQGQEELGQTLQPKKKKTEVRGRKTKVNHKNSKIWIRDRQA